MQCGACGTQAQSGQRFCGACGAPLHHICAACGYENPADHRFCGGCGSALDEAGTAVAPRSSGVPAEERRVVSVLFVDLVGFTSFSEGRDPEDVRAVITRYFDVAREAIERFGGTVDKFIGDAVMAWWGATLSHEDDAERAVRASLEIIDRVVQLGADTGIPGLSARVGVMTGEVSVGPGGNEKGLLLGDLVNVASRLQSLAEPGSVLIGSTTAGLVGTAVELVPAGTHQLKGREEPVEAFRAARVVSERGGRGRSDTLEPPFVGRAAELRMLKDALHATGTDRRARLVSLVGQAGIGKSRLVWEFLKYIDGLVEVVYWHEGRSPAYGDGVAMWALGEMIRQRAGISETDDDTVTMDRLDETVARYVAEERDREWVRDRLAALLGVGSSVGAERTELFAAARMLFEGIAAEGTVVLTFEDLHWADPALLEFIDELPDWSQNHPILIVTLARPDLLDRRPEWGSGRRGFSSTYLGPLADSEVAAMLEGAVPGIPAPAVDRIVEAAGGVPLFAVEMLRTLLSDGRLVIGPDGVEATDDLSQLDVPSSVQAVVSARLDRLATEEREIVRDASVLGQSFTVDSLAGLRDEAVDKVERRLSELVRREIFELVRDPRSPERGQYRWVQSVLREVAYSRIAKSDRHQLHLRVARQLRSLAEPELAPVVAAHFVAATETAPVGVDLQQELSDALRAAIGRAQVLHAHEQILGLVASALDVAPAELEMDLREIAALAAVRLSDVDQSLVHARAALDLATGSADPTMLHRAVALTGRVNNENRNPHGAAEVLEPHLAEYPDFASDPNLARAAVYLARTRLLLGDDAGSANLADRALAAVEKFNIVEEVADALVTRGTALAFTQPRHAIVLLRGALALAREHDLNDVMLRCLINIGYGGPDFFERRAATIEAYEEAKRLGDRSHAGFVAGNLGGYYSVAMDHDRLEELLEDPVWRASDLAHALGMRAELAYRRGDWEAGRKLLEEGRELAASTGDPQTMLGLERGEAMVAMFEVRGRDVFEIGRRHFLETSFAPGLAASVALEGAAIEGDPALLDEVASFVDAVVTDPSLKSGMWHLVNGLRLVVGGEDIDAGVAHVTDAIDTLEPLEWYWVAFEARVFAARWLPKAHPVRADFIAQARKLAEDSDAPGLIRWLEAMTA
ncbi:MAG: AAA family ATPase [Acidimicrobiia bacterium]